MEIEKIKEGTQLIMKKTLTVCTCDTCKEFRGMKVTFDSWSNAFDDQPDKTPFHIKETQLTLFLENVERIVELVPEHLFEI